METKNITNKVVAPTGIPFTLGLRALSVAKSQLGCCEIPKGSNWGKDVKKYLASVGINFPASWCMAFVYWCVEKACEEVGAKNPLVKTGGVLMQWNKVGKNLRFVKDPKPGDIFIMDFGGGKGHTGFVTAVKGGRIETIEGNSNDEGSREGFEVCRKPGGRAITSIVGYIRVS